MHLVGVTLVKGLALGSGVVGLALPVVVAAMVVGKVAEKVFK